MTELNWTQYQEMFANKHQKIDKLVDKYIANPNHPKSDEWKQTILNSGLYDEKDLEYLVKNSDTTPNN